MEGGSSSWALVMDDATRPSEAELQRNSRSRSAILHVMRKVTGPRMAALEELAYQRLGWDGGSGGLAEEEAASSGGEKLSKAERKARKAEMKAEKKRAREEKGGGGGGAKRSR